MHSHVTGSTTREVIDLGHHACSVCEEARKARKEMPHIDMNALAVLDHGYVKLIETWGSDERVIEAARMSTGKGFKGWGSEWCCGNVDCGKLPTGRYTITPGSGCEHCGTAMKLVPGDEKLLAYLYTNAHMTPFEMAGMVIEVKAPIFVFREWHRHRTQSYNEMSARYVPLPDENYMPSMERITMPGGFNKQAQGTGAHADENTALMFRRHLEDSYRGSQQLYEVALANGVPKELARLCLPVARYSKMRASANLRNWLAFLTLRDSDNAQWEIRMFAQAVGQIIGDCFPRTFALFDKERKAS